MFRGIVGSESLENPLILNSFHPVRVVIEYSPNSTINPYWHIYLLRISSEEINHVVKKLSEEMKHGCFAIFWNDIIVYVVFKDNIFNLPREGILNSKEYQKVKEYAIKNGIQEEYLDFRKEFNKFKKYT